jgi:hypothetical protein
LQIGDNAYAETVYEQGMGNNCSTHHIPHLIHEGSERLVTTMDVTAHEAHDVI